MLKNNYSDVLIANPGTRLQADRLTLEIRLPWYRSLPLSVVEVREVNVDSRALPLAGGELVLEGRRFAIDALAELTDVWWYVQDTALLHLSVPGLQAAQRVELLFLLYPPYIPMLTWATRGAAVLSRPALETTA